MNLGLHLLVLEVTGRCNLSCNYCYRYGNKGSDLDKPMLLLDQLSEIKPHFITISGGEPLLLKNIFSLCNKLRDVCEQLYLTTNGTLVKNFLRSEYDIFDDVQISLDGNKELHEKIRGKGTFKKAVGAARYLNGIVPVSFLCTINSANLNCIGDVIQIARKVNAVPKIGRMCGFGTGNPEPLGEPILLKNVLEEAANCSVLNDDPLNFWFDKQKRSAKQSNKIVGGCTAGIAGVAISPELDVYPCVKLRIPAGNLKEQSLKDIWLNSPLFATLRDWHNLKGHCPSCEYVSICRGCRADAWARTGDYLAPDPLCWLNGRGEE